MTKLAFSSVNSDGGRGEKERGGGKEEWGAVGRRRLALCFGPGREIATSVRERGLELDGVLFASFNDWLSAVIDHREDE